jgi:hypothetical protein
MKQVKRTIRTCVAVLLVVCALSAGMAVQAKDKVKMVPETLWMGDDCYGGGRYESLPDDVESGAKVVKIKSSDKKVLKVVKDGKGLYDYYLVPKKAGKAKISVTYEFEDQKVTLSATYTVKKYPKPISSLKVNGKKMDTKKNLFRSSVKWSSGKSKIEVKPSSGWKVADMCYFDDKDDYHQVKNGKKFSLPKNTTVHIELVNKKGENLTYHVDFEK